MIQYNLKKLPFALALAMGVLTASSLLAGPFEEAEALYKAGKFAEVDEKLGDQADSSTAETKVIRLSFLANIKAGRPYTAERRFAALNDKKDAMPAEFLYLAAINAGDIGKLTLRRDRLIFFLTKEKGWNENVAHALAFLCRDNGDPEQYARLMTREPASASAFDLGLSMLRQMRTARRSDDYVKQVDVILSKYKDPVLLTRLFLEIDEMFRNPTSDKLRGKLVDVLVKYPVMESPAVRELARSFDEFDAPFMIDYATRFQKIPTEGFWRISKLAGAVQDAAAREVYGAKLKKLLPLISKKDANGAFVKHGGTYDGYKALFATYETILANHKAFGSKEAPLFSQVEMAQMFAQLASRGYNDDVERLRKLATESAIQDVWGKQNLATMLRTYPKLFEYKQLIWDTKLAKSARDKKDLSQIKKVLAAIGSRMDVRWQTVGLASDIGDKAFVRELVTEQVLAHPANFDANGVARAIYNCQGMSVAEKVNFLNELFTKVGYSDAFKQVVNFPANAAKGDPSFKALAAKVVPGARGNDPISGACSEIFDLTSKNADKFDAKVLAAAKRMLAAYKGQFPDEKRPVQSSAVQEAWLRLVDKVRSNDDRNALFVLFAKSFGPESDFGLVRKIANDSRNQTNVVAALSISLKNDAINPNDLHWVKIPAGLPAAPYHGYYGKMATWAAVDHVKANAGQWPHDVVLAELAAVVAAHPVASIPDGHLSALFGIWEPYARTNATCAKIPLETMAVSLFDKCEGSMYARTRLLGLYCLAGQREAALARALAGVKKISDPVTRYDNLASLIGGEASGHAFVKIEEDKVAPKPLELGALVRDELLPALRAVPRTRSPFLNPGVSYRYFSLLNDELESRIWNKRNDEALLKTWADFFREFTIRRADGYMCNIDPWRVHRVQRMAFSDFSKAKRFGDMAHVAYTVGYSFNRNQDWNGQTYQKIMKDAMDLKAYEPVHIAVSSVRTDNEDINSHLQRLRAECATHMPGIYPVPENHPLYPLYVAADELERNNPERAWALLQDNLQTFEREAVKLSPDFVAWGVEQLRHARGKRDALLLKARQIATQLLANEKSLTHELAASLMLTRAECYRDQLNYESARLEYQTIRNGEAYKGTKAARRAMFRDVDLLIEMGNVSQAESIVEYWLSQPEVDIQAEGHYFLARIAFERKDYEETRKQLDEVFNLDFTHTSGRLLHGAWKLATNNEVDDTNVIIGNITDRTLIRPGQELSISVQDRNLGVAGGGSFIPIVIKTAPGNDVEQLNLYPSIRNPYIFSGSISTKLGSATPTNRFLEVFGSDEVTYEVEPTFLSARGLTTTPPKRLRVVDDARLAIGAAAPMAEEGKAEADLERQLTSTSAEKQFGEISQLSESLKPGNPIYVVVRDRDRSLTAEADTLSVMAKTTSGDRLANVSLKETGPDTGIFRGEIPTTLPPPRASASDAASGVNVGDTINSKRSGTWKSAPDGAQGKWIEVDTMASHAVSNVAIMMADGAVVKNIQLSGQLIDRNLRLGSYPAEDISTRYGFHYQVQTGPRYNDLAMIRTFFSSEKTPDRIVRRLGFVPYSRNDQTQNAYLQGFFQPPEGVRSLRLRFVAKDTKGRTLAGLWMAMALDGVTVFTGQGNSLHRRVVEIDVTPGPHLLEVFFSANYPDDAMDIFIEESDGSLKHVPAEWTDPKVHPALTEFVKDRAKIVPIKQKGKVLGFQATFEKPVRVRILRWTFSNYTGRELEVQKMYVQDAKGRMIIPVESDYSDALDNDTLEVAPGDSITVAYSDDRTSSGEKRILDKSLKSSFHDAALHFYFEQIVETRNGSKTMLHDAYRFLPGDLLLVSIFDSDMDISPEADVVKVKVTTRSGAQKVLSLTEQNNRYENIMYSVPNEVEGIHTGHFMAILRTAAAGNTNAAPNSLPIARGDVITMTYFDRENTTPGVPVERKTSVQAAQASEPSIMLFDTWTEREEDTSVDAKIRLAQIRRRPGNERIEKLYRDVEIAKPMDKKVVDSTNDIPVNVAVPVPIMFSDASRARHEASTVMVEAAAGSEISLAEMQGRDPEVVRLPLKLDQNFGTVRVEMPRVDAIANGVFTGLLKLHLGPPDPSIAIKENEIPPLPVNGNDTIRLRFLDTDESVVAERNLRLVSEGRISLMDSTYSAGRNSAHVGERFFIQVEDPDLDSSDDLNKIEVVVTTLAQQIRRKVVLSETLPHSGLFTGVVRPVIFAPGEEIPSVATGGVATAEADYADERIAVRYGDSLRFDYYDKQTIPGKDPGWHSVTGRVFKGSDGNVRLFSKRFRDSDMAVLVQFRLAECLFEEAKDFRRMKQPERSAKAIAEGKYILEEALRNYPTTTHVVEGEFLLANLFQELAMEEKVAKNDKGATALFSEALSRFSSILSTWPDSEFAPRAQYHKALCLEMLKDYNRSAEEYVKMTYLYPESPLVGDASIRLATYYYKNEKRYDTAGRIYANFQRRFPTHEKADRALFMSGQCHMKQAQVIMQEDKAQKRKYGRTVLINDEYVAAVNAFNTLVETYSDSAKSPLRAQAMYWAGDASLRAQDYEKAFLYLKRTVFEYPETEWARRARGLLLQEAKTFEKLQ